ncbi:hypothetical protein RP20_CCG024062 [Aedes albopictus]|nr:hypothetical protein RP20_CCG024062 [Aedes albopictus]
MVGWKFRGNFPSLWKEADGKELDRIDLRERDSEAKLDSKKHADKVRGAKESSITIGDVVLLHQQRKSKTDPSFAPERYTVVTMQGPKVVVMSGNGIQYTRNVQDIKLAPAVGDIEVPPNALQDHPGPSSSSALTHSRNDTVENTEEVSLQQSNRNLRSRRELKKPSRYDNNFIYRIYQ